MRKLVGMGRKSLIRSPGVQLPEGREKKKVSGWEAKGKKLHVSLSM